MNFRRFPREMSLHFRRFRVLRLPSSYPLFSVFSPGVAHFVGPSLSHRQCSFLPPQPPSSLLIFQILHAPNIPQSLINFIGNSNHTFVGVGIKEDVEKIVCDYKLSVAMFVDQGDLAVCAPGTFYSSLTLFYSK